MSDQSYCLIHRANGINPKRGYQSAVTDIRDQNSATRIITNTEQNWRKLSQKSTKKTYRKAVASPPKRGFTRRNASTLVAHSQPRNSLYCTDILQIDLQPFGNLRRVARYHTRSDKSARTQPSNEGEPFARNAAESRETRETADRLVSEEWSIW